MVERTLDDYVEGKGSPGNGIGQWKIEYCGICATGKAINNCVKCGNKVCPEHFVSIMGLCVGCAPVKNAKEISTATEEHDRTIKEGMAIPHDDPMKNPTPREIGNRNIVVGNDGISKDKGKNVMIFGDKNDRELDILCIDPDKKNNEDLNTKEKKENKRPSKRKKRIIKIDWV